MNGFAVQWKAMAETQLAEIWLAAPDRDALRVAVSDVDRRLAEAPFNCGEARSGNDRIVFGGSLILHVEVLTDVRVVNVLSVHQLRPRRG